MYSSPPGSFERTIGSRCGVGDTFWTNRPVVSPDTEQPIGVFEAYICRHCGYTELYARDAGRIPIGDEYGTELFETGSDAPYR